MLVHGCLFPASSIPRSRVTDFWFQFFLFLVTLLGATTSETSGATARDLLETRCGALQVLSGNVHRGFWPRIWCADLGVRIFVAEFSVRILARVFQMGVQIWCNFCRRRQAAESRISKFRPKSRTRFSTPGQGSGRGLGGDAGRSTVCSWLGAVEGNKATGLNCSLVPFHCLPCTSCLEFSEYHL